MIKAVIFDLDGTLLDTIPDIAGALNRALGAYGLPTHPVRVCERFVGDGIRNAVARAVPEGSGQETIEGVLAAYLRDYAIHCADETAYYPGVMELLQGLADRGVLLGILSNKTERDVLTIVGRYFPEIPFRCVYGQVDSRPLKPDAAAAGPVLAAVGLPAEQAAYVGDSGTDMTFARAAGMLPVAAPWGYRARRELEACGAALVPADCGELLRMLTED